MTTYTKEKPESIQAMFDKIAERYDRGNAIISFGFHRYWNSQLVKTVKKGHANSLADLCCGTGDIAIEFLKHSEASYKTHLIDFSQEMLNCAKVKMEKLGHVENVEYTQADVQQIPLTDASVSCATVAYGIRNVKNPKLMINEAYRILQPGGSFGILELTRPNQSILKFGHSIYLNTFVPLLGKWVANDHNAYQYLKRSIEEFVSPKELEKELSNTGFIETSCIPLFGGIATIIYGKKPV